MAWRCFLGMLAGLALLTACRAEVAEPEPSAQPSTASPEPRLPAVEQPLGREALLLAVTQAASDYGFGRDDAARQRELDGKRFEVRLAVGCPGDTQATRTVEFDEVNRQLRISLAPEINAQTSAITGLGLTDVEAVDGFWIYRPWLLTGGCPRTIAQPAGAGPTADATGTDTPATPSPNFSQAPEEPRIGIARFYATTDSRAGRRGERAYQLSRQLAAGEQPSSTGYELVLSGRLEKLPSGQVVACSGDVASRAPSCIVSAHIDRVTIVHPGTGTALAEWTFG
jgi:hypothetical protein